MQSGRSCCLSAIYRQQSASQWLLPSARTWCGPTTRPLQVRHVRLFALVFVEEICMNVLVIFSFVGFDLIENLWSRCKEFPLRCFTNALEALNAALIFSTVVARSICQSVSSARWPEDQQEEDLHQEGRHEPHLQ